LGWFLEIGERCAKRGGGGAFWEGISTRGESRRKLLCFFIGQKKVEKVRLSAKEKISKRLLSKKIHKQKKGE